MGKQKTESRNRENGNEFYRPADRLLNHGRRGSNAPPKKKSIMKSETKTITSLAELLAVIEQPLVCRFAIDGRPVELKVRRISSAVDEQRRAILRAPLPPWDAKRNDYVMLDPNYRAARELAEEQARAVVVYHCCPEVAALKPGLLGHAEITEFVKTVLPPLLLETIALTALAGGFGDGEVNKRANFTSADASES